MGDLMYVIGVIVITVAVITVIIVMGKKQLDKISSETFQEGMEIRAEDVLGETSDGEKTDPADALFDSPYYDRYEPLFNYIWSTCHGRNGSQNKIDWLLQSLDMGRILESDGHYVRESIEKDLPYFCETEQEFEMFFRGEAPILRGSVKGILDIISFYRFTEEHPSKQEYWQHQLLELAQNGGYGAQAALCANIVNPFFAENELMIFKEMYESDIMRLAEDGHGEAQLAVGEFLVYEPPKKVAWLLKAARQGLSDACYQLGLTYESMISIDDDGQFKPNRLSEDEVQLLMVKKAECFLNGANADNGVMAAWCQYKVGSYYAEGDLLSKDLEKAAYWLRRAIENGEDAQDLLDHALEQMAENV